MNPRTTTSRFSRRDQRGRHPLHRRNPRVAATDGPLERRGSGPGEGARARAGRPRKDWCLRPLRAPRAKSVPDGAQPPLRAFIRGRVALLYLHNSAGWRGYNSMIALVPGHFHVEHVKGGFAQGTVQVNGIKGFWGLPRVRLAMFKGMPRHLCPCTARKPRDASATAQPARTTLLHDLRHNSLSWARAKARRQCR